MDIFWGMDSGLVLKNFTDHKNNVMSIEIIPINNNIWFIETIDLNTRVLDIHSRNFVKNHVGHNYDNNSSFLSPMKIHFALDQMNPLVFWLIQYSIKSLIYWYIVWDSIKSQTKISYHHFLEAERIPGNIVINVVRYSSY